MLADEALVRQVFGLLDRGPALVSNGGLVCKAWRYALDHLQFLSQPVWADAPAAFPNLRHLTVQCVGQVDVSALSACPRLSILEICDLRLKMILIRGLSVCASLTSLRIQNCRNEIHISDISRCRSLRHVSLDCCPQLVVDAGKPGLSHCTALCSLDLTESTIADLAVVRGCGSLRELKLNHCGRLTDVSALSSCSSLEVLELQWCRRLVDASGVASCHALRSLDTSECNKLVRTPDFFSAEAAKPDFFRPDPPPRGHYRAAVNALTTTAGGSAGGGADGGGSWGGAGASSAPAGSNSALRVLNGSFCKGLVDVSSLALCRALVALDLSRCRALADISALEGCVALERLDLRGCAALRSIAALAGCAALRELLLSGCVGVSDLTPLAGCGGLRTLKAAGCSGVTDTGCVLASCPQLRELDLTGSGVEAPDGSPLSCQLCEFGKLNMDEMD